MELVSELRRLVANGLGGLSVRDLTAMLRHHPVLQAVDLEVPPGGRLGIVDLPVLDAGRVVEHGSRDALMSEPRTPAARRLLRAAAPGHRTPPATTNRERTR